MFVQALAGYADTHLRKQLDDVAFEERPVQYFLQIGKDGSFLGVIPRFTEVPVASPKQKKGSADKPPKTRLQPELLSVPRSPANRNSGLHPLLGSDDIKYVLGPGPWTKASELENHRDRHEAFVELLRRVAKETRDRALEICAQFYDQPEQVERAREALAKVTPGSNVALFVFGQPVTERDEVRAWWRQHYEASTAERGAGQTAECLISGVVGPIPSTHAKIKGTSALGGQPAGVSLMSFDKPAFRSYGWEQNANSPVSSDRAMAYVLALNDLLKPGSQNRKDFDGVAFLFWLKRDVDIDYNSLLEEPPSDVLLDKARAIIGLKNGAWMRQEERNELYMAAVSATGSRLVLRSWSSMPLEDALESLLGFWEQLKMQPLEKDKPPRAEPFWKLLHALDREGRPPASRTVALRRRALEGRCSPLGYRIVSDVLARMRADKEKRRDIAALGLLRLCLNDLHATTGKGEPMPAALDETEPPQHPAYVCGRLLALHDSLQWRTFDAAEEAQPNATVADRYYTLMMNSPAIGVAKVFDLGRKHLSKLRKLDAKSGTSYCDYFTRRICELEEHLGGEPPVQFDLHDKARFALGFYHEKAPRFRARKAESISTKLQANSNSTDEENQ
ncbi:type I-C CRISPR-associated protein Cas8c/Csd1 [Acidobacterium capsulatum]|uniref:CRISPR-associated protein, Csd1 family n=1 Tax=Acidobacterium capsulatum (strain ATCC 51196 / DSM 11244 / BCRC 80197 / JCM 7670 / NBRC 15755 / NCIMB 13165 / 161) TaxID=240015 RepID=C1F2B8_ACIC5|nr:CRISPR-associated protein, Csd1 family [Acidobacterium capsulatum ATCC 51196]HCT60033.1 type I-C CRISPR-associated protein Cas8c/Csd1 [Acidobacterium sp.]